MRVDGMPTLAEERRRYNVEECKDYFLNHASSKDWTQILADPTRVWNRNIILAVMIGLNLSWTTAREIIIRSQCSLRMESQAKEKDAKP